MPYPLSHFACSTVKQGLVCRFFDLQINKLLQIHFIAQ